MTDVIPIHDMTRGTRFEAFGGQQFVVIDDRHGRRAARQVGGDEMVIRGRQLVGCYGRIVDEEV